MRPPAEFVARIAEVALTLHMIRSTAAVNTLARACRHADNRLLTLARDAKGRHFGVFTNFFYVRLA